MIFWIKEWWFEILEKDDVGAYIFISIWNSKLFMFFVK